ncbi:MAG: hypothetical protein JNK05_05260 [Myxococcales bacterium]|nr:hypothetical protein [Myxococcales bacterium]
MNSIRLLASCSALSLSIAACASPSLPQDSGVRDTGVSGDTGISQSDASDVASDTASPSDVATPMDVASPSDVISPRDVPNPPNDVASDNPSPTDSGALFCMLPLGGTCPAGTTCPAGDGCNRCSCPDTGGTAACTRIACPPDGGVSTDGGTGACRTAGDCRMFESYCATEPCACIPLSSADPDPRCDGRTVTCFVPPCRGQSVDCVAGRCVLAGSM